MGQGRHEARHFYIDGDWVEPSSDAYIDVIDPASEVPIAAVALGQPEDVDRAVAAANSAFDSYAATSREERISLLQRVLDVYARDKDEMGALISREMKK